MWDATQEKSIMLSRLGDFWYNVLTEQDVKLAHKLCHIPLQCRVLRQSDNLTKALADDGTHYHDNFRLVKFTDADVNWYGKKYALQYQHKLGELPDGTLSNSRAANLSIRDHKLVSDQMDDAVPSLYIVIDVVNDFEAINLFSHIAPYLGEDVVLYWGDGAESIEFNTETVTEELLTHTYARGGVYVIAIYGGIKWTALKPGDDSMKDITVALLTPTKFSALYEVDNGVGTGLFAQYTQLNEVGGKLFNNLKAIGAKDLTNAFKGCPELTVVPYELLEHLPATSELLDFSSMFQGDGNVEVIPEWWKDSKLQNSQHKDCFTGCIKSPNYLVACVAGWASQVSGGAGGGETVADLLKNGLELVINVPSNNYTVDLSTAISNYPSYYNAALAWGYNNMYVGLSSTIAPKLLCFTYPTKGQYTIRIYGTITWGSAGSKFTQIAEEIDAAGEQHALSECLIKVQIPTEKSSIYAIKAREEGEAGIFSDCAQLTTVPEKLFSNVQKHTAHEFIYAFQNTKIGVIYPTWLAGLAAHQEVGEVYLNNMFAQCPNIKNIPSNLFTEFFKRDSLLLYLNGMFYGCTGLVSIQKELLTAVKAGHVVRTNEMFRGCSGVSDICPAWWEVESLEESPHKNCFTGCSKAPNYIFACLRGWAEDINSSGDGGDDSFLGGVPRIAFHVTIPSASYVLRLRTMTYKGAAQMAVVNYGDGTAYEMLTKNVDWVREISHTFAQPGEFVITIYGEIVWGGTAENESNTLTTCLTAIDVPIVQKCAIRDYKAYVDGGYSSWFSYCSKLVSVSDKLFNNLQSIHDFTEAFRNTALTEVPAWLMQNIPDTAEITELFCDHMFEHCTALKTGNFDYLFSAFKKLTLLECTNMFSGDQNLTDVVGKSLFANQTGLTTLTCKGMFDTTNVQVKELNDLFSKQTKLQSLQCTAMFRACPKVSSVVPNTLFAALGGTLETLKCDQMFQNDTGIRGTVNATLLAGFKKLTSLNTTAMFQGCTGITAIEDGLLRGISKLVSLTDLTLGNMFQGCSGVTGLCPDYWNDPVLEAAPHANFYTGCSKTTNYKMACFYWWASSLDGMMEWTLNIPNDNYKLDLSKIITRYSGATDDPLLSWGDETITKNDAVLLQSNSPATVLQHTYATAGVYKMRFTGKFTMRTRLDANGQLDVLTKILTKVATPGENGCIYRIENQGTTEKHQSGEYNGIFFGCSHLLEVGENVFTNLTSFGTGASLAGAFRQSSCGIFYSKWLQHIPSPTNGVLLLDCFFNIDKTGAYDIPLPEDVFSHLPSGITELDLSHFWDNVSQDGIIPANLFASLPTSLTTLRCNNMFPLWYNTDNPIPAGLFKKLPSGLINLYLQGLFRSDANSRIHSIPQDLFSALPSKLKVLDCSYMFSQLSRLEQIPATLFSKLPASLTTLSCTSMFEYVWALASIPDALLRNLPTSVTQGSFKQMFYGCSVITTALPTWWDKPQLEAIPHTNCFTGCTKATNYMLAQVQGWASGVPDFGLNLTITTPSANFILDLSQRVARYSKATFDPVIDWGDGSEQTGLTNLKHTYTAQGTYTVKIYGEIIWQKLATPITNDSKQDSLCKCLTRIAAPEVKCSIADATNVAYAGWFAQCHLLTTIPANLFNNLKNVAAVNFDRAFHGTAISSIPSTLFANIPAALKPTTLSCAGTFCGCPNLSSIPADLFHGLPSTLTTINLVNCFQTSPKITTVPATLFSYLPSGVKTLVLQGALMCGTASSGGLTSIPNALLHKLPSGLTSFNMWALCWNQTQLSAVPADFFAKLPTGIKDLDIHCCFMNCKKLTTIPAALLTSIPSAVGIKNLTEMFRDCSAVTGTLPEYWNTAKLEAVTHTDFYTGCIKATNYLTADVKGWATANLSLTFNITPTASTLTIDLSKRIGTNAVNSTLDWGDGSAVVKISGGNLKHTYATAKSYTITISGQIWVAAQASNKGDAFSKSLISIGVPAGMSSSIVEVRAATAPDAGIFANCTKLTSIAANTFAMVTTNNMTIMQEPTLPIPEVATDSEEDVLAEVVIETVTLPLPETDTMIEEVPQLEAIPELIDQDPVVSIPEEVDQDAETVVDLDGGGHIGENDSAVLFHLGDKDVELSDYATLHFSLRVDPDIKVTSIRTKSGRMLFEHQDFISRFGQLIFPQNPITLFPEMQFMAQSYDYRRRNVYCYPLGVDVYGQVDRILHYVRGSQSPKSLYLASAQAAGFPVVREDCEVLSVVPMHSGVIYYTTHGHYEAPFPHAHLPVGTRLKAGEVIAGNQLYRMVLPGDILPGNVQYINLDYALPIRGLRAPNMEIQVYTEPNQLRPEFEGNSTALARYHRWLSKYDGTYDYSRYIPARMNAIELVRDYLCAGRCIIVCVNTYHITDEMYLRLDSFLRRELPLGSVLVTAPYHGVINEVEGTWGAVVEPEPPPQQEPNGEDWPNGAPGSQGNGNQGGGGGQSGKEEVEAPEGTYEFVIDQSQSDPDKMITYAGLNKKYTPAHIDDETGLLDYGDWADSWLLQQFKPCMLHANGKVAYYLNPKNLSQKVTGESVRSDLTSDKHDMNAMVEVGQIWVREVVEGPNKFHVYISPTKGKGFDCYTHYNAKNGLAEKYYFGMFKGSLDANLKIRSLSGKRPCTDYTGELQKEYCANNGSGWGCREWSFQRLMQYICLLLGKSTNTQAVFGNGYWAEGQPVTTGGNENKGLFYGSTTKRTSHVTLLGMEDFWGNVSDLCNGLWNEDDAYKVKLTPGTADGSEATGYTDDTSDYTTLDVVPPVTTKAEYVTQMMAVPGKGLFPIAAQGGSADFYYTDVFNARKKGLAAARVGYGSPSGASGVFALDVATPVTEFSATDGVTLSYKDPEAVYVEPEVLEPADGSIRFKIVTTGQNMEVDVSDWFYTNEMSCKGELDWGDGSFPIEIVPLQSKAELKHTYTIAGEYWIEATGILTLGNGVMKNSDTLKKILYEVEVVGNECPILSFNRAFYYFHELKTVTLDKLFSNRYLRQATSLTVENLFRSCTKLTTAIPANMFPEGLTELNCREMFIECTSLTCSLPENMFPSTLKTLDCNSMFNNGTAISGISTHPFPEGLQTLNCGTFIESTNQFEVQLTPHFFPASITSLNCRFFFGNEDMGPKAVGAMDPEFFPTKLSSFNGEWMFDANSALTSIPADLGTHLPTSAGNNLQYMFRECTGITDAVPELWKTHQSTTHSDCFRGCVNASNWVDVPTDWGGNAASQDENVQEQPIGDHENTQEGNLLWWQWDKKLLPTGRHKLRRVTIHCRNKLATNAYTGPVYLGVWDVYEPENDVRPIGVSVNTQTPVAGADLAFNFTGDLRFTSGRSLRFLPLLKRDDKWYDPPTTVLSLKVNTVSDHTSEPETYVHSDKNLPAWIRVVGELRYVYVDAYVEPEPEPEPESSERTDENGYIEHVFDWYAGKGNKEDDPHYRGTGYVSVSGFAFRTSASSYFQEDWPYVRIPLELALPLHSQVTSPFRFVHYAWCWADSWKTTDWKYPSTLGAAVTGLKTYNPRTLKEITNLSYTEASNALPCVPVQKNSKGQYFIDVPVYTKGLKWSGVLFGLGGEEYYEHQRGTGNRLYVKADIFVPDVEVWYPGLTPDNSTSTYCPDLHMVVLSGDDNTGWGGGLRTEGVIDVASSTYSYPATLPDVTLVNKPVGKNMWSGSENYNGQTADKNSNKFPICENVDYATKEKAYDRGEGNISLNGFIIRTAALGALAKTAEAVEMSLKLITSPELSGIEPYAQGNFRYSWVISDNWQNEKYWQAPFDVPADGYDDTQLTDSSLKQYNPITKQVLTEGSSYNYYDSTNWPNLPNITVNGDTASSYPQGTSREIKFVLPLVHPQTKKRLTWTGIKFHPAQFSGYYYVYTKARIFRPYYDSYFSATDLSKESYLEVEVESAYKNVHVNIASFGKATCCAICCQASHNVVENGNGLMTSKADLYTVGLKDLKLIGSASLNVQQGGGSPEEPEPEPEKEEIPMPQYSTSTTPAAQNVNWYNGKATETTDEHYLGLGYTRSSGFVFRTAAHSIFSKDNACVRVYIGSAQDTIMTDWFTSGNPTYNETQLATYIAYAWCFSEADDWENKDWNYTSLAFSTRTKNIKTYNPLTMEEITAFDGTSIQLPKIKVLKDSKGYHYADIPVYSKGMKWTGVLLFQCSSTGKGFGNSVVLGAPYLLTRIYGSGGNFVDWDEPVNNEEDYMTSQWPDDKGDCPDLHMLTFNDYNSHSYKVTQYVGMLAKDMYLVTATHPCVKAVTNAADWPTGGGTTESPSKPAPNDPPLPQYPTDPNYDVQDVMWYRGAATETTDEHYLGLGYALGCGILFRTAAHSFFSKANACIRVYMPYIPVDITGGTNTNTLATHIAYAWCWGSNWATQDLVYTEQKNGKYVLKTDIQSSLKTYHPVTKEEITSMPTDLPLLPITADANKKFRYVDIPVNSQNMKWTGVLFFLCDVNGTRVNQFMVDNQSSYLATRLYSASQKWCPWDHDMDLAQDDVQYLAQQFGTVTEACPDLNMLALLGLPPTSTKVGALATKAGFLIAATYPCVKAVINPNVQPGVTSSGGSLSGVTFKTPAPDPDVNFTYPGWSGTHTSPGTQAQELGFIFGKYQTSSTDDIMRIYFERSTSDAAHGELAYFRYAFITHATWAAGYSSPVTDLKELKVINPLTGNAMRSDTTDPQRKKLPDLPIEKDSNGAEYVDVPLQRYLNVTGSTTMVCVGVMLFPYNKSGQLDMNLLPLVSYDLSSTAEAAYIGTNTEGYHIISELTAKQAICPHIWIGSYKNRYKNVYHIQKDWLPHYTLDKCSEFYKATETLSSVSNRWFLLGVFIRPQAVLAGGELTGSIALPIRFIGKNLRQDWATPGGMPGLDGSPTGGLFTTYQYQTKAYYNKYSYYLPNNLTFPLSSTDGWMATTPLVQSSVNWQEDPEDSFVDANYGDGVDYKFYTGWLDVAPGESLQQYSWVFLPTEFLDYNVLGQVAFPNSAQFDFDYTTWPMWYQFDGLPSTYYIAPMKTVHANNTWPNLNYTPVTQFCKCGVVLGHPSGNMYTPINFSYRTQESYTWVKNCWENIMILFLTY